MKHVMTTLAMMLLMMGTAHAIRVEGSIENHGNGSSEVDAVYLTVLNPGVVTFDSLVYEAWGHDFNNDGHYTAFDCELMLFRNDGTWDASDYIIYNDDAYRDSNGSYSSLDSYLSRYLAAGDYILTIGALYYDANEAIAGWQSDGWVWESNYNRNGRFQGTNYCVSSAYWAVDICGDVMISGPTVSDEEPVVPEPATLSLLGLGLAGIAAVRRRRHGPACRNS